MGERHMADSSATRAFALSLFPVMPTRALQAWPCNMAAMSERADQASSQRPLYAQQGFEKLA